MNQKFSPVPSQDTPTILSSLSAADIAKSLNSLLPPTAEGNPATQPLSGMKSGETEGDNAVAHVEENRFIDLAADEWDEPSIFQTTSVTHTPRVYKRTLSARREVPLMRMLSNERCAETIAKVRRAEYHSPEQRALKQQLEAFYPAIFRETGEKPKETISKNTLVGLSGIQIHDFDCQDNTLFADPAECEAVKDYLTRVPGFAYVGRSASGTGLCLITAFDKEALSEQTQRSPFDLYKHLYQTLSRCFENDPRCPLKADPQCCDPTHARYVSCDPHPRYDLHPTPIRSLQDLEAYYGPLPPPPAPAPKQQPVELPSHEAVHTSASPAAPPAEDSLTELDKAIREAEQAHRLCFDQRSAWVRASRVLAETFGEAGRPYFHRCAALSPKYHFEESEYLYTESLKNSGHGGATLKSVFWNLING